MDAIQTKFLPATNTRGARIKAWNSTGSITIPYPHELHGQAVHRAAAEALSAKQGTNTPFFGKLLSGAVVGGYVFVFDNGFARD